MSDHFLRLERIGPIATLTLDRAMQRNALTPEMLEEIERVSCEFAADEQTRAVILRADGNDFSVGVDINQMGRSADAPSMLALQRRAKLGARLLRSIQEIPQPTICAIQGIASGGATCIATACDFRIASSSSRIGYGEVKLGMTLMWNALPVCVRLVGPARAKQLVMSGKLFSAATLLDWGLLDEVCEQGDLDARAAAWAAEYAALPPIAVQMIKRSVNAVSGALDRAIMHMDADQWLLALSSGDFHEGIAAFKEKRKPEFRGR